MTWTLPLSSWTGCSRTWPGAAALTWARSSGSRSTGTRSTGTGCAWTRGLGPGNVSWGRPLAHPLARRKGIVPGTWWLGNRHALVRGEWVVSWPWCCCFARLGCWLRRRLGWSRLRVAWLCPLRLSCWFCGLCLRCWCGCAWFRSRCRLRTWLRCGFCRSLRLRLLLGGLCDALFFQ